jgi:pyruvyl transferase EpsO
VNFDEKKGQLNKIITDILTPLIDNDFVLMDLPYHTNIGDNLIFEGEIQFLKHLTPYKLLYSCNAITHKYKKLNKNIIILLHGGGNFGDVWYKTHEFKKKIISLYPENKIIIFPQTIYYDNKYYLFRDIELYSRHSKLTICARDKKSYDLLKEYFRTNAIFLVPDMAFCIDEKVLKKYYNKKSKKVLFLKRTDIEFNSNIDYLRYIDEADFDIHDWPSMEKRLPSVLLLWLLLWLSKKIHFLFPIITDKYVSVFFKSNIISKGLKFVTKYNKIYTTRLHVAILCCLLEKPFTFFDNSYGKNSSFFDTWLTDLERVRFINHAIQE